MRILQISSAESFGGGEKHLAELSRGLVKQGHSVFAAVRRPDLWQDRLGQIDRGGILHTPLRGSIDVVSAFSLAKFIRKNNIQIVHAHLARDYPVAALAVRLSQGAKLVLTRHVLFPMSIVHRVLLRNAAKVIAVSAAVEAGVRRVFGEEKVTCIPNGIDVESFAAVPRAELSRQFRDDHSIHSDAPLIGTVGELKPLKGQEDFVLAANEIRKSVPDAHFVSVGKDNTAKRSYRTRLKRLVKVLGLQDRFLFLDWVEDTAPVLSAMDVFVSPSRSESFGLAILEAMAAGTAVVATKTGGAKELLEHEVSGLLVSAGDPVAVSEGVCRLLDDGDLLASLGGNAQLTARERFDIARMIKSTEALYLDVTDQTRS